MGRYPEMGMGSGPRKEILMPWRNGKRTDMHMLSTWIEEETHKRLRIQAAIEERSIMAIVDEAINQYVAMKGIDT